MTEIEKIRTIKLKANGCGYRKIAAELGLSENTVKSFLKRNCDSCIVCGTAVIGRKYCSDKCRMAWWRKHPHRTSGMLECQCETCGKKFFAYPSKARKYCSKACYGKSCQKEKSNEK